MDSNLQLIKTVAQQFLPNCRVLLFGSRARGDFHQFSDYDVLLVTSRNISVKEKMPIRTNIRKELASRKIYADIIVQSEDEMMIKKNLPGHLIQSAVFEALEI